MRTRRLPLLVTSAFLLACAGLFGEPTDSADTATDADSGSDEEEWSQSSDCEVYLDCLKEVDRDEWEDQRDKYGEDGSCWGTDDNVATACDDDCEEGLADLAEDNPDVPECGGTDTGTDTDTGGDTGTDTDTGGDTGTDTDTGGDTGTGGGCPLDEGDWTFSMTMSADACGIGDLELPIEVACTTREEVEFRFDDPFSGEATVVTCDSSGLDFTCLHDYTMDGFDLSLTWDGRASSDGRNASGTFIVDAAAICTSEADFTASL